MRYFLTAFIFLTTFALPDTGEFFHLMGNQFASSWSHVKDPKDFESLDFFAKAYEHSLQNSFSPKEAIPKKIHFIWVGPNSFPKNSIENIKSWKEHHKDYEIYLWTDRNRSLPEDLVTQVNIDSFQWTKLEKLFHDTKNYAEKADLLRYEILYQIGGIYVDHDVKCFKPFDDFRKSYNLFCGLEPPHKKISDTAITICNNLIGASQGHPILKNTIDLVFSTWEYFKLYYPEKDDKLTPLRVYYRTFLPFHQAVTDSLEQTSFSNIVFPSGYFNKIGQSFGYFAHHEYASSWFESESSFEHLVRKKLEKITKKENQTFFLLSTLIALVSVQFILLLCKKRTANDRAFRAK